MLGEIVVLVAFGALIFAGIRIAANAKDVFGRLLAAGIVSWFGLQTLINLGAVTGLLPVTGVPLPFLSYGGPRSSSRSRRSGCWSASLARRRARTPVVRNHRAGSPRDVLRHRPKVGADPCRRAERRASNTGPRRRFATVNVLVAGAARRDTCSPRSRSPTSSCRWVTRCASPARPAGRRVVWWRRPGSSSWRWRRGRSSAGSRSRRSRRRSRPSGPSKAVRPLVEAADVVVGMGGYVSVPVVLAALRSRRPVVLHEQNAVPGLANRTFARPARTVALAFAEARRALPRRARPS